MEEPRFAVHYNSYDDYEQRGSVVRVGDLNVGDLGSNSRPGLLIEFVLDTGFELAFSGGTANFALKNHFNRAIFSLFRGHQGKA